MRYGNPPIASALRELAEAGCARVLLVPLYPQYAGSTTRSTHEEVQRCQRQMGSGAAGLRLVRDFHEHPGYIAALAASVREHWAKEGRGGRLLMSFHGLPRRVVERGDPYQAQCLRSAHLLAEALRLAEGEWQVSFQSRFGRAEWLQPYTGETLAALAAQGVKEVDLICPGFVSDCLETLEEIAMGEKEAFLSAGGKALRLVPCLNERPDWIAALTDLTAAQLRAWQP
jgi:ferrochelatase